MPKAPRAKASTTPVSGRSKFFPVVKEPVRSRHFPVKTGCVSRHFAPKAPLSPNVVAAQSTLAQDASIPGPSATAKRKRKTKRATPTEKKQKRAPSQRKKVAPPPEPEECSCDGFTDHLWYNRPTLIQEEVRDDPWKLVIATTLLNKTHRRAALPAFRHIIANYPTPESLSQANIYTLEEMLGPLGLQKTRAARLIKLSMEYLKTPPDQAVLYKSRSKGYPPTAISHLPGVGKYALDSYRIFSPDLPGGGAPLFAIDWAMEFPARERSQAVPVHPHVGPYHDEWRNVMPEDKELRKYLIWRWGIEGYRWDPERGLTALACVGDMWDIPHWS